MEKKYLSIKESLEKKEGEVFLRGWVHRYRDQKTTVFITLRDVTGVIQLVCDQEKVSKEIFEKSQKITVESSISLKGTIRKEERAPQGYEIDIKDLDIVGLSETYPISKDFSEEFLLDVRHLWLRSRKMQAILKIRSTVFRAIHDYFRSQDFYEYQSPTLQSVQCEGGSSLFHVDYFGKKGVFLAQTWQLYAEPAIFSLERIYTLAPSFRAEKSKTTRHLAEYWHAEMEGAWVDFEELQVHAEGLIKKVISDVIKYHEEDLKTLKRDVEVLKTAISKPFVKMTYSEAIDILKKEHDMEVEWGKDLRTIEEDLLSKMYDTFIIITRYPKEVKAFYMKEDPKDPRVVLGFDCIGPEGYGEIIGASEREDDIKKIIERLEKDGEDVSQYDFYLDTRKYGSVPHSGFGMGVERIISYIIKADTIKDAIPFPRTMVRYKP